MHITTEQAVDADLKATQTNFFAGNLVQERNTMKIFILGEVKETILGFSKGTVRAL